MAAPRSVWGIDIGQCALKAIKLREVEGQLMAEAFDVVEHPTILSEPQADREALIRQALETFVSRNDLTNCKLAVSVSGQTSFTKFVKMPPVEAKRIPDLVKFEAEQQIPFDINEVIWRWQAFPDPDSPDLEVGLFAIKQSDVYRMLAPFAELEMDVELVQMAPLALFNFMAGDHQTAEKGATLLIDIGADSTDLVVADGPRVWTRTVQLGGNNFTEALVKAFKLSFSKAEKLKVTAATSKYARQVFQAMRPVFADLVQEIQRSVGYYTSLHRQSRFVRALGLGNGFRLPGLQKFLEQNLNMPVVRVDSFTAVQLAPSVSGANFSENVLGLAVAYGLALQALELSNVNINMLPGVISAQRRWTKKRPWFAAAAVLVSIAALATALRQWHDWRILSADPEGKQRSAQGIQSTYNGYSSDFNNVVQRIGAADAPVKELLGAQGYRSFWPHAIELISDAVQKAAPDQALLSRPDDLKRTRPDPAQRQVVVIESIQSEFKPDLAAPNAMSLDVGSSGAPIMGGGEGGPRGEGGEGRGMLMGGPMAMAMPSPGASAMGGAAGPTGSGKGFRFVLTAHTPLSRSNTYLMFNNFKEALEKVAQERYGTDIECVGCKSDVIEQSAGPTGMGYPTAGGGEHNMAGERGGESGFRPQTVGASTEADQGPLDQAGYPLSKYTRFRTVFILKVKGDGVPTLAPIEITAG